MADLKHRDWLLFSTKSLILSVDQNISIKIVDTPNGGKWLIASGISDNNIDKLRFLVNTDQNNNYLYLEDFKVYIKGTNRPLNIPGLSAIMTESFRLSDANGFLLNNKTHTPFVGSQFSSNGETLSQFVDKLTGLMPYTLNTNGSEKTYEIILNPDDWMSDAANALNPNRNGFTQAMDPNQNGLAESARNTGEAMASWNAMGSGGPMPAAAGLHLLRMVFESSGTNIAGDPNMPAAAAVPGSQTPGQVRRGAGCSIM